MGICFGRKPLPKDLVLEVAQYLEHTGSLSCTCKGGRKAAAGRTCCPSQQFHHPISSSLIKRNTQTSFQRPYGERLRLCREEKGHGSVGWLVPELKRNLPEEDLVWKCCGGDFHSTGCTSNRSVSDWDGFVAIQANDNIVRAFCLLDLREARRRANIKTRCTVLALVALVVCCSFILK